MKIKFPHFLPYPETPILTRQERLYQRQLWSRDLQMMKTYGLLVIGIFLTCYIGSLFASLNDWKEEKASLHQKICQERKDSVFCTDTELFDRYVEASHKKWVPPGLVFGIMFAESSLHTNYNKPVCKSYNNPFWLKWYKQDDWRLDWYTQNRGRADAQGCWLYKFASLEEWLNGLLNTISMGYKKCENDVTCISYAYVGDPNKAEESWIGRVNKFYKKEL